MNHPDLTVNRTGSRLQSARHMKPVTPYGTGFRRILTACCVCALMMAASAAQAQVSFYTVVDQALRNSSQVKIAEAEVRKAEGAVSEVKDAYIPNLSVGSGLGYSFGFTINPPTLYNVNSQSLLFSFSQHDYIRAARAGLHAAQMHLKDIRQQIILETAESYIDLDMLQHSLAALRQESGYSERLVNIVNDRFAAGLESKVEVTHTRLGTANIHLKQLELNSRQSEMQDHLAHLTGLPAAALKTDTASIPAPPAVRPGEVITGLTPGLEAAFDIARSKQYQAYGVKREEFRPQAGLGAQYNRYSTLADFQQNFPRANANNFSIGLNLTWPLFDQTRKAKRVQAEADAVRAQQEFAQFRDQTGEQVLKLENTYTQLAAQQEVAELTAELAQDKLDAIVTQSNGRAPGITPLTPKDEQTARIEERQRYIDALDAKLALAKIQLELLRATGSIEAWARSPITALPAPAAP